MTRNEAKGWAKKMGDALGATLGQRLVNGLILGLITFMATTGKSMVRTVYAQETREAVAPAVDSLIARDGATNTRIDTLAHRQQSTDDKVEKVDAKLDALIQVMSRAFPEFKKAAKERAQENMDSKEVQEALTGGTP